jgi:CBS domain containing-hemolysin-like protein
MVELLVLISLTVFVFVSASLMRTFKSISTKELRRRSRMGDKNSKKLYYPASHAEALRFVLWGLLALSFSLLFIFLDRNLDWWLALPLSIGLVWFAFAWMPSGKPTRFGWRLAVFLAPTLNKVLEISQPINSRLIILLRRYGRLHIHTGLYEKDDLIELIKSQAHQPDNRIDTEELKIAIGALSFADKIVRDCMTPRRVMKTVRSDEVIGPVLLDELHSSGFSRFPVLDAASSREKYAGTLYFRDLAERHHGGTVRGVMSERISYVNEEQSLLNVLEASIKTHNHLFMVVNNFEEVVGVISLEDVVEQIIGRKIVDEFDEYEDLRATAASQANTERSNDDSAKVSKEHSQSE